MRWLPGIPGENGTRSVAANSFGASSMFFLSCATPGVIVVSVTDHLSFSVTWMGVLMNLISYSFRI